MRLDLFHYTTQARREAGIEWTILAETLARCARRRGLETFLLTGTDEHDQGQVNHSPLAIRKCDTIRYAIIIRGGGHGGSQRRQGRLERGTGL